jgi:hypothetical protein
MLSKYYFRELDFLIELAVLQDKTYFGLEIENRKQNLSPLLGI